MIQDSREWTWEILPSGEVIPKIGAMMFIKLLEQYIICKENDYYPGYSVFVEPNWKGERIGVPRVPGWYRTSEFNFYNDNNKVKNGTESKKSIKQGS